MKMNRILPSIVILGLLLVLCPVSGEESGIIGGETGTYRVHCNVDGARVYFDGELAGEIQNNILDVPVYLTGTPYRSYSIEKEGYRTYSGPINSVPAKGQVEHIYVTLSALPPVQYGRIHVLATPAMSEVTLDNTPAGQVDDSGILVIYDVRPGGHTVVVSKEGYISKTSSVYVDPNEIVKLPVTLEPVKYGTVSVNSVPPGAGIYIDDGYMGETPIMLDQVSIGAHTVKIELPGYQPYTMNVQVSGDAPTVVNADLVTAPATGSGQAPLGFVPLAGALAVSLLLVRKRS